MIEHEQPNYRFGIDARVRLKVEHRDYDLLLPAGLIGTVESQENWPDEECYSVLFDDGARSTIPQGELEHAPVVDTLIRMARVQSIAAGALQHDRDQLIAALRDEVEAAPLSQEELLPLLRDMLSDKVRHAQLEALCLQDTIASSNDPEAIYSHESTVLRKVALARALAQVVVEIEEIQAMQERLLPGLLDYLEKAAPMPTSLEMALRARLFEAKARGLDIRRSDDERASWNWIAEAIKAGLPEEEVLSGER